MTCDAFNPWFAQIPEGQVYSLLLYKYIKHSIIAKAIRLLLIQKQLTPDLQAYSSPHANNSIIVNVSYGFIPIENAFSV